VESSPSPNEGFSVRSALPRVAAVLAIPALLLTACASADPKPSASSTSGSATNAAAAATLKTVSVTGDYGKKPKITLEHTPTVLTSSGAVVLKPGTGPAVTKGQRVFVDFSLVNATTGKEALSSFGQAQQSFLADPDQLMPGLANSLIGQKLGSRVLAGVTPKDGFGDQGNQQLSFTKDDGLIFVMDLKSVSTPLTKATGDPVTPPAGLPTVTDNGAKAPTVTIPKAAAPTKLVVQPLIKGKGPAVKKGQTVSVQYVGEIYGTSKVFDSSYSRGQAASFPVGTGGTIPGFDKGLTGQTVGSRVLLVIPPADGYGKQGNSQAGIKGTDTLVFVVDILDAY